MGSGQEKIPDERNNPCEGKCFFCELFRIAENFRGMQKINFSIPAHCKQTNEIFRVFRKSGFPGKPDFLNIYNYLKHLHKFRFRSEFRTEKLCVTLRKLCVTLRLKSARQNFQNVLSIGIVFSSTFVLCAKNRSA